MPPRIQFKHIKRLDEIPPPEPAPVKKPAEKVWMEPPWDVPYDTWDDDAYTDGWYHYRVTDQTCREVPELQWRTEVYRYFKAHGYEGGMYEFFCRDCKETRMPDRDEIRFSWYHWNPRPKMRDKYRGYLDYERS